MSRSYKHTPSCGEGKNKYMKRYSNKVIRQRLKDEDYVLKGNDYKKVINPWNIEDYRWYKTLSMYLTQHKNFYFYDKDEDDLFEQWCKWFFRK